MIIIIVTASGSLCKSCSKFIIECGLHIGRRPHEAQDEVSYGQEDGCSRRYTWSSHEVICNK